MSKDAFNSIAAAPYEMLVRAKQNAIPLSASFELTPRCNFNCGMCYVHLRDSEIASHGKELSAEQWISFGRQAMQAGTLFLCITGGEPTRHPEFCRIYSELSRMGFIITLQSNLYRLDDECFELLKALPPQCIKFTIYGASDETYRKVCGVSDGFTKVIYNIKRLKELGIFLEAVTTVTRDNVDDLPEISRLMKELCIPWMSSTGLRKSVRGAVSQAQTLRLPNSAYAHLCEDVENVTNKEKRRNAKKPCEKCRDYRTGFWIKWDGKMSFCSFLDEPDIDAVSLGLTEAWKRLVDFEEKLQWPEECQKCRWSDICPRCAATLATESGTVNKVSKDYCRYIDKIFSYMIGGK